MERALFQTTRGGEVAAHAASRPSTRAKSAARTVSPWKIWLPIPVFFVLLELTFPLWFWKIPKLTDPLQDIGYQFLLDTHRLYEPKPPGSLRVVGFGSSVSRTFDPAQVQGLIASETHAPVNVDRLLMAGMKPADYRLFWEENLSRIRPDVAVIAFNLVDFFNPDFEEGQRPEILELLPPWRTLRERGDQLRGFANKLDRLVASVSELYRYRRLLWFCIRDHLRFARDWVLRRGDGHGYGWYADGWTRQRFGIPLDPTKAFTMEYFVHPEWIRQRGRVELRFWRDAELVAVRVETEPGWKKIEIDASASGADVLHVVADSAWNPRAAGLSDDVRLLAVQLRTLPGESSRKDPPLSYPPYDPRQLAEFLRMGHATGSEFERRFYEILNSKTPFGERFRSYQEWKLGIRDQVFTPTGQHTELERMVRAFAQAGVKVVLANTPENPWLLNQYQDSPYYRAYIDFLQGLAARYPGVQFLDLRSTLPPEDFNDWHHVNYVGIIKLGPHYAKAVQASIAEAHARHSAN